MIAGVCLFVSEQDYTKSSQMSFIKPRRFEVAEWQPFWIFIIIYCILHVFIDIHQLMPLLLTLIEGCTFLRACCYVL